MTHQSLEDRIEAFFEGEPHAVVGASQDREKYGNKVLRAYLQSGRPVYPVNPNATIVEGVAAVAQLRRLPESVHGISIVTPPSITELIIEEAASLGIKHVWMQPGAESDTAIKRALELGLNVIAGEACILVVLGYREGGTVQSSNG